jgi:zinc transport system substrate-binding protein
MSTTISSFLIAVFLGLLLFGCSEQQNSVDEHPSPEPYIVAVNGPLQYFALRLLSKEVDVRMLVPTGIDPGEWKPNLEAVLQLQRAELILLNGAGYSPWLSLVSVSESQLVKTNEIPAEQWIALEDQVSHSHGPGGEHAHPGYAYTTWMDMSLARIQVEAVAAALLKQWPKRQGTISAKLTELLADIDSLDAGYQEQSDRLAGFTIIYSHPVYQYFERRYGMSGRSLHWEPNVMPTAEQWQYLESIVDETTLFIWEAEPSQKISIRLSEMNVASAIVNPGANPVGRDWLTIQQENLANLKQVASK